MKTLIKQLSGMAAYFALVFLVACQPGCKLWEAIKALNNTNQLTEIGLNLAKSAAKIGIEYGFNEWRASDPDKVALIDDLEMVISHSFTFTDPQTAAAALNAKLNTLSKEDRAQAIAVLKASLETAAATQPVASGPAPDNYGGELYSALQSK